MENKSKELVKLSRRLSQKSSLPHQQEKTSILGAFLECISREKLFTIPTFDGAELISQRSLVVGWMYSVTSRFNYSPLTLTIAVEMLDICLVETGFTFDKNDLFSVSTACLYIAMKFNEITYLQLDDVITLFCGNALTKQSIIENELFVLRVLKYELPRSNTVYESLPDLIDVIYKDVKKNATQKNSSFLLKKQPLVYEQKTKINKASETTSKLQEVTEKIYFVCLTVYQLIRYSKRIDFYLALIYTGGKRLSVLNKANDFPRGSFFEIVSLLGGNGKEVSRLANMIEEIVERFVSSDGKGFETLYEEVKGIWVLNN